MTLIIINGLPASGKTTLAKPLSELLGIPLITKDTIKEFLFDSLGVKDREWSRILGRISNDFLYVITETMLADGQSLMIENAFEVSFAKPKIQKIISTYNPLVIEIYCLADPSTRNERFIKRNESGNRHKGHVDHENYHELAETALTEKYAPLALGELLKIDTSKKINVIKIKDQIESLTTA